MRTPALAAVGIVLWAGIAGEIPGALTLSMAQTRNTTIQDRQTFLVAQAVQQQGGAPMPQANQPVAPGTIPNRGDALPGVEPGGGLEGYTYDPSGRRDPFVSLIRKSTPGGPETGLPPLQRVGLTEINLIGIIWGGFGFTAMVQTSDGKGYSVRRGTRIGPNNGVVSTITDKRIVVTERFTDIYGKRQEKEFVKDLHPEEESE